MKLKTQFQDEDFKFGEVADVAIATTPDGRIMARATAKAGGEHTLCYDNLKTFADDWEDYEEQKDWIDEVKVQELPSGLKIADRDYYEFDGGGEKKTEFDWDEAMEIEQKTNGKWRLPTPKELNQIALDLGYNKEGVFEGKLFAKNLGIKKQFEKVGYGNYWSLRSYDTMTSSSLYFGSSGLSPQSYGARDCGFAVRCVSQ